MSEFPVELKCKGCDAKWLAYTKLQVKLFISRHYPHNDPTYVYDGPIGEIEQ